MANNSCPHPSIVHVSHNSLLRSSLAYSYSLIVGIPVQNCIVGMFLMCLILTGLKQAWNVLRAGSRYKTSNSLRLVVLVTDGAWTVGGDPISVVSKMKADMASDGVIYILYIILST